MRDETQKSRRRKMKKNILISMFTLFVVPALVSVALAGSSHQSGHSGSAGSSHDMVRTMETHGDAGHAMDSDAMTHDMNRDVMAHDMASHDDTSGNGMEIRTCMVNGYHLTYRLINMKARMAAMEGTANMPEMKATHHLMLFIKSHDGHPMDKGRVGFFIENPDGTVQKAMAMGMGDGYGADVVLDQAGSYTIKAKALAGKDKVMDRFSWEVTAP